MFLFCTHLKIWYRKKMCAKREFVQVKYYIIPVVCIIVIRRLYSSMYLLSYRKMYGNLMVIYIYTVCIFFSDLVKYNMKQFRKVLILIHNTFLTPPPPEICLYLASIVYNRVLWVFFCKYYFFLAFLNLDFVKNVNMFFSTLISRSTRIWKTKSWWNLIILCGFLHKMRFFFTCICISIISWKKKNMLKNELCNNDFI